MKFDEAYEKVLNGTATEEEKAVAAAPDYSDHSDSAYHSRRDSGLSEERHLLPGQDGDGGV